LTKIPRVDVQKTALQLVPIHWKIMGAPRGFLEEFNEQIIPAPKKNSAKKAPSSDASRVLR
jgi:hypothetical protein